MQHRVAVEHVYLSVFQVMQRLEYVFAEFDLVLAEFYPERVLGLEAELQLPSEHATRSAPDVNHRSYWLLEVEVVIHAHLLI